MIQKITGTSISTSCLYFLGGDQRYWFYGSGSVYIKPPKTSEFVLILFPEGSGTNYP